MTYMALLAVIKSGNFDLADMRTKLDIFFIGGRITEEQYRELLEMITVEGAE